MTREEAIKVLRDLFNVQRLDTLTQEEMSALAIAIEALEQQPCEDCISRQEAINCVTLNEFRYKIVEDIKTLPSVTPKEKTGHWKPIEYDGYADGYPVWDVWECSKCGCEHNGDKNSLTAFCPDCGARMVEPQESEVDNG